MTVRELLTRDGTSPYRRWLEALDLPLRSRIQARVLRFELGNRLYFGKLGPGGIVLIVGGEKHSQTKDIAFAQRVWAEFLQAARHGKAK